MAVHCRPWTSAVLALRLEVGFLIEISTAWLSLADPILSPAAGIDSGIAVTCRVSRLWCQRGRPLYGCPDRPRAALRCAHLHVAEYVH
jgi:hypothetical protein